MRKKNSSQQNNSQWDGQYTSCSHELQNTEGKANTGQGTTARKRNMKVREFISWTLCYQPHLHLHSTREGSCLLRNPFSMFYCEHQQLVLLILDEPHTHSKSNQMEIIPQFSAH